MNLGEAADVYLSERKRNRSLSTSSLIQVTSILWRFCEYMGQDREPATIKLADVSEWAASIGCGPRTLRSYVSHVRGLFLWLILRDEIGRDPFLGIQLPRNPDSVPRAFEAEAVGVFFGACADSRETLIVSLGVQEGLRAGEVAALEVAHVARQKGAVFVRGGKGNKDRWVPLTDETRRALTDYLAEHPARSAGPLIRSYVTGNALKARSVSRLMTNMMYRSGLKEASRDGVSFHALRHTAASDVLIAADGDLLAVKEFLGHASIATTQVYTRTTTAERLRAVVNTRTYRTAS